MGPRGYATLILRSLHAAMLAVLAAGCAAPQPRGSAGAAAEPGARVGVDPIPHVELFENHSRSLVVWRRAGVRDRILVHVDGHSDLDWLPDGTIARLAAAEPGELPSLELHPYTLDGSVHERFAIWNFVYPAARIGVVREYVWVVPDGTLADAEAAGALVRHLILGKMQMVALDEAKTLRWEGRVVHGTVLGIPVTVCELSDLPAWDEPVLLDIDLDFLTTRSAESQEVVGTPWITPAALVAKLRERGLRADVATVSLSTMGGYLPPACRWVGDAMVAALQRGPDADGARWASRGEADRLVQEGREDEALALWRRDAAAHPGDGSVWYALARGEARAGREAEAEQARSRAVAADPALEHAELAEADAAWLNQRYGDALELYRGYRRAHPSGPYLAYGLRREGTCLMRTGRDEEAIEVFRKVVALAPRHGDTRLDLGVLLRDRGDLDGAIAQFREARAILPDLAAYAMALGAAYARRGDLGLAIEQMDAAVARRPTWAHARARLGILLLEADRPVDAASQLGAAAMLEPKDPEIGRLLARLKRQGITSAGAPVRP